MDTMRSPSLDESNWEVGKTLMVKMAIYDPSNIDDNIVMQAGAEVVMVDGRLGVQLQSYPVKEKEQDDGNEQTD